jgi:hypothetical protein
MMHDIRDELNSVARPAVLFCISYLPGVFIQLAFLPDSAWATASAASCSRPGMKWA